MRLGAFGAALAVTALLAYAIVVAPDSYGRVACDTYSPPHLLALVLAGASFVAAAGIGRRVIPPSFVRWPSRFRVSPPWRLLVVLFPQCLAGPYAAVDVYVRDVFLGDIGQEQSLFARRDFVLSGNMVGATALFVGATAPAVIAIADRFRDRNLLIVALFALLAWRNRSSTSATFAMCRYWPLRA